MTRQTRLLSIKAVVAEYGIGEWKLRDLIEDGAISIVRPPAQPGQRRRAMIDRVELERLIESWKCRGDAALDDERERDDRGRYVKTA
jgi:hypothetical protein